MIAKCPKCNNSFYVSRDRLGTIVSCSRCNQQIQIQARMTATDEGSEQSEQQKSTKSVQHNSLSDGINVGEGLKRMVMAISFVFGPIIWTLVKAKDIYTLNANFSEPVDNFPGFMILWAIGFASVWAIYVAVLLLIRGFGIGKQRSERPHILRPLIFLAVISLIPLIPGFWDTANYMAEKTLWYGEDIAEFFVPGPLIGFAAVWGTFILAIYVGRGFRYKRNAHVLQAMRHRLANQPQSGETPSDVQWRTS